MKWEIMGDLGLERSEHEHDKFLSFEGKIDVYGKPLHRRVNMIYIALIFEMDSHWYVY